jgi:MFS family permease
MATLYVGVFMAALDTAVIGPAIPALRAAFGVDNREVGLVMIVFVLLALCSTALMANLSDRHGRRPVYLASVALFALGSLVIALSPRFWMVLAGRALQGIGAGGIIPTASAVIGDVVPIEGQGRALGMIGAIYGMAFVLGPPLAAGLMVALSWHWIFLANLPIAAVILVLGARVLPAKRHAAALPPLDASGIVVVFALLAAVVLAITHVADTLTGLALWPWSLALAVLLVPVLVVLERRAAQPMIPLSLFRNRRLATAYGLTIGAGFGMGSVVFLTSIAHLAYGVAPDRTGFALLPLVVCSMLGSMVGGRLLNRTGSRALILAGFALLATGYAAAAITRYGLAGFLVASIPIGLGVGIVVGGALRLIAIDEAPDALRGTAQGLINICNSIGTLLSAAIIGAIADYRGGDPEAFGAAYLVVALVMVVMLVIAVTLRADRGRVRHAAKGAAAG